MIIFSRAVVVSCLVVVDENGFLVFVVLVIVADIKFGSCFLSALEQITGLSFPILEAPLAPPPPPPPPPPPIAEEEMESTGDPETDRLLAEELAKFNAAAAEAAGTGAAREADGCEQAQQIYH